MRITVFFALWTLLLPFDANAEPIAVVASFSILGDFAREVGGNLVAVKTLVGADGDAHVYEPTPADAKAIAHARLLLINGLGFEGWISRLIDSSGYKGLIIVASSGIKPLMLNGKPDPHAWPDIENAKIYVKNIRDGLIKIDPPHRQAYRTNAERYLGKLNALDIWVQKQMATVPENKRQAITSHDALRYFAARYHVTFLAPLGATTADEPRARDIARLIDQIRSAKVRAIFLENMSDPRLMQELAQDGGAVIGGTLYSDALSPPNGDAPDYIAMTRHNVLALTQTMQKN